jgi:hypothetical protein
MLNSPRPLEPREVIMSAFKAQQRRSSLALDLGTSTGYSY